jgi:hypothetical protein
MEGRLVKKSELDLADFMLRTFGTQVHCLSHGSPVLCKVIRLSVTDLVKGKVVSSA